MDIRARLSHQVVMNFLPQVEESLRLKQQHAAAVVVADHDKATAVQATLLTSADQETDLSVVSQINLAAPGSLIISEEGELPKQLVSVEGNKVWTVDPIDGTNNFIHGLPFGVLIGQFDHQLQPEYGVVSLPSLRQRIYGGPKWGIFQQDQLKTINLEVKGRAMVTIGPVAQPNEHGRVIAAIEETGVAVRDFGCSAWQIYQLLTGQADCFIAYNLASWDIGPALALVPAAGLAIEWISEPLDKVNILRKEYSHQVVFGKPQLVSQIARVLRSVR